MIGKERLWLAAGRDKIRTWKGSVMDRRQLFTGFMPHVQNKAEGKKVLDVNWILSYSPSCVFKQC